MQPTQERWLPIAGWEGYYEVSDHGRVRSLDRLAVRRQGKPAARRGRVMALQKTGAGHLIVRIQRNGHDWTVQVHVLVLTAFVGPRPPGLVCRHLDGNPENNIPDNLAWGTSSQNKYDSIRHGTDP